MAKSVEEVSKKGEGGGNNVGTRATMSTVFRASSQSLPANNGQQYSSNWATTTSLRILPTSSHRTHHPVHWHIVWTGRAHIPGDGSPWLLDFTTWRLIFMRPPCGTYLMSTFGRLEFGDVYQTSEKCVHPLVRSIHSVDK